MWEDLFTEEAITRTERIVSALIGTMSNPYTETFGTELKAVVDELDWEGEPLLQLLASLAGLSWAAVSRLAQETSDVSGLDEDTANAALRDSEMQWLRNLAAFVEEAGRTNMFKDDSTPS